jgi:glycosyltransferase involved in cell wall biosynthesis
LQRLVADAWAPPNGPWSQLAGDWSRRLSERFHPELADAEVQHFTAELAAREFGWRLLRPSAWQQVMARNGWFARKSAQALRDWPPLGESNPVVFAHSYSARDAFAYAKSRGWTTVLGQIDPGPTHVDIVQRLSAAWPQFGDPPAVPPPEYFRLWREECDLADWIVVNSEWARQALTEHRVPATKLTIIPLGYQPEHREPIPARVYPAAFSSARPLRVLYVGHVAVAKGVPVLLAAMAALADLPITLRIVGSPTMSIPPEYFENPRIEWVGPVPRHDVMRHYRECDVLVFPSWSDGFGMAQIEAQGWRLPIIASRNCGRVVEDDVNGILLDDISVDALVSAFRRVVAAPDRLAAYASRALDVGDNIDALGDALLSLAPRS